MDLVRKETRHPQRSGGPDTDEGMLVQAVSAHWLFNWYVAGLLTASICESNHQDRPRPRVEHRDKAFRVAIACGPGRKSGRRNRYGACLTVPPRLRLSRLVVSSSHLNLDISLDLLLSTTLAFVQQAQMMSNLF